jgi:glycine/sarcosine N-methyltransferase
LKSFYNSLSKGGKLIIDERNYPLILVGKYYWSGKYVYCGKNKTNFRIYYASHKYTAYQYTDKKTNTSFHIIGYTMKENEMQELLKKVGFKKITKYGDYKEKYNKEKVEFYIYVAEK